MLYALSILRRYTIPANVSGAPPSYFPCTYYVYIVAEVVRATADSKSIKGLQITKPVFQVSQRE